MSTSATGKGRQPNRGRLVSREKKHVKENIMKIRVKNNYAYFPYRGSGHIVRYTLIRRYRDGRRFFTEDFTGTCIQLISPKTGEMYQEDHYQDCKRNDVDEIPAVRRWKNGAIDYWARYDHGIFISESCDRRKEIAEAR
jgi:hypothetical protein